jgi:hypothetical protein
LHVAFSTMATARSPPIDDSELTGSLPVKVFVKFSDGVANTTYELPLFKFYYIRLEKPTSDLSSFYIYT